MRAVVASICLLALQAAWLGGWLVLIAGGTPSAVAPTPLLLAGTLLYVVAAVLLSGGASIVLVRTVAASWAGVSGLLILLAVRSAPSAAGAAILPLVAFAWMYVLAARLASDPPSTHTAWRQVQIALVALVALGLGGARSPGTSIPTVVLAFCCAGSALALTRLDEAVVGGGLGRQAGHAWPPILVGVLAAVLVAASILARAVAAAAGGLFTWPPLVAAYHAALVLLLGLLGGIVTAAAWVLERIYAFFSGRVGPLPPPTPPPVATPAPPAGLPAMPPDFPAWITWVLTGLFVTLLFALLGAWLIASLRRFGRTTRDRLSADVSSDLSLGRLAGDAAAFFAAGLEALRAAWRPKPADALRSLYRSFLAYAAMHGAVRQPAETAGEFAPRARLVLQPAPPSDTDRAGASAAPREGDRRPDPRYVDDLRSAIDQLTLAYERVRYADAALSAEDLAAARRDWHRIRRP